MIKSPSMVDSARHCSMYEEVLEVAEARLASHSVFVRESGTVSNCAHADGASRDVMETEPIILWV